MLQINSTFGASNDKIFTGYRLIAGIVVGTEINLSFTE